MSHHNLALKEALQSCEHLSRERGLLPTVLPQELESLLGRSDKDYTMSYLSKRVLEQVARVRQVELAYSHAQTNLAGRIRELQDYLENG